MILVLEGMDCAGKTTLAKEIQRQWDETGTSSIHKFPTKDFDPSWKAEDFFADFRKHFPWEEHDTKHLCIIDRFWQSTWVYQRLEHIIDPLLLSHMFPVDLTVVMTVDRDTWEDRMDDHSVQVLKSCFSEYDMFSLWNRMMSRYCQLAQGYNTVRYDGAEAPEDNTERILRRLS